LLNKIRNGIILEPEEWNALTMKKQLPEKAFAVRLMSRLYKVKNFNEAQLRGINEKEQSWNSLDSSRKLTYNDEDKRPPRSWAITKTLEQLKSSISEDHRFSSTVILKKGAKVVLLANTNPERGLVNGAQGEIVGFKDTKDWKAGDVPDSDTRKRLAGFVEEFYQTRSTIVPIVRFTNGFTTAITPVAQESLRGTNRDRYSVCRTQIPLTLAWALSIHKSQGMTLEYVEVSSEDIFEAGQLYVGLSRATKLEGLTVSGFSREQKAMDEDVLRFYENTTWEDLGPTNKPRKIARFKKTPNSLNTAAIP
jgi:ATP-dependent DNA helicase PIF1